MIIIQPGQGLTGSSTGLDPAPASQAPWVFPKAWPPPMRATVSLKVELIIHFREKFDKKCILWSLSTCHPYSSWQKYLWYLGRWVLVLGCSSGPQGSHRSGPQCWGLWHSHFHHLNKRCTDGEITMIITLLPKAPCRVRSPRSASLCLALRWDQEGGCVVIIRVITMVMMTSMTMPIVIIMMLHVKCVTSQIHRCHQSFPHKNQEVATPYSLNISRMVSHLNSGDNPWLTKIRTFFMAPQIFHL